MTFDPARLLTVLNEHGVAFVLIGQAAALLRGAPATTMDVDIVPLKDIENAERLAAALDELGGRHVVSGRPKEEWPPVEDRDFLGWPALSIQTDAGPIDVVPDGRAVGPYEEWARHAELMQLDGFEVLVASLDDVITSKEALGREKDRAHLPALYALRKALEGGRPGEGGTRG